MGTNQRDLDNHVLPVAPEMATGDALVRHALAEQVA